MVEPSVSVPEEERRSDVDVVPLAERWISETAPATTDPGFAFRLADGVLRPESVVVAASSLRTLDVPRSLSWAARTALQLGGAAASALPVPLVPFARRAVRRLGGAFVVDARPRQLSAVLESLRAPGFGVSVTLVGEAVVGDEGEGRRLDGIRELIARPDVDHVTVRLSDLVARRTPAELDGAADDLVAGLLPLARAAATNGTRIDLAVDRYREVDLGIVVFTGLLETPDLTGLDAGIELPGAVPDVVGAIAELGAWASARVAAGGHPIRVRLAARAGAEAERVEAALHGWPLGVPADTADADAAVLRALDALVEVAGAGAVGAEFAATDPFLLAHAWLRARDRGIAGGLSIELPLGDPLADAVAGDGIRVRILVPAASPDGFDAAVVSFALRATGAPRDAEALAAAYRSALAQAADGPVPTASSRTPDRSRPAEDPAPRLVRDAPPTEDAAMTQAVLGIARHSADETAGVVFAGERFVETAVFSEKESAEAVAGAPGFRAAPDTDPTLAANREWARRLVERIAGPVPDPLTAAVVVETDGDADALVDRTREAARTWAAIPAAERAPVLAAVAAALDARRADLVTVTASETGVPWAEADAQVDESIDAAAYDAATARELDRVGGAVFLPDRVALVVSDVAGALAGVAGGVLAALAAGAGVVLHPAPGATRTALAFADVLHDAGIAADLLTVVSGPESEWILATHPGIDRVVAVGDRTASRRFRTARPERPVVPGSAGLTPIVVTPSADIDRAAEDVVRSAFGPSARRRGQTVAILVGTMGRSRRLARQLADAARSLRVGPPTDPRAIVGPVPDIPSDDELTAATVLGDGEAWLVEPVLLDRPRAGAPGRLWSPGVRVGVAPDSPLLRTGTNLPVLAILHAATLAEAVELQNALGRGIDAGLHSRDPQELARWLDTVSAGSLWVNRPVGGARPQRQPRAAGVHAGTTFAPGGPNHLVGWGSWRASVAGPPSPTLHLRGLDSRITTVIEAAQPSLDYDSFEWLRRAALSDALVWDREFGRVLDVSRLGVERNLFRYRSADVEIRATLAAPWRAVLRAAIAAIRAGSGFRVSVAEGMAGGVRRALGDAGVPVFVETDEEWIDRIAAGHAGAPRRVRLIGGSDGVADVRRDLAERTADVDLAVFADEVTTAGRIELLPFLAEQAITITAHRLGRPDPWSEAVI